MWLYISKSTLYDQYLMRYHDSSANALGSLILEMECQGHISISSLIMLMYTLKSTSYDQQFVRYHDLSAFPL